MDMWCPDGIGRGSWDREVLRVVCSPLPPRGGDLPRWCVFPFAGVSGSAHMRIIVVVVVVVLVLVLVLVVVCC